MNSIINSPARALVYYQYHDFIIRFYFYKISSFSLKLFLYNKYINAIITGLMYLKIFMLIEPRSHENALFVI